MAEFGGYLLMAKILKEFFNDKSLPKAEQRRKRRASAGDGLRRMPGRLPRYYANASALAAARRCLLHIRRAPADHPRFESTRWGTRRPVVRHSAKRCLIRPVRMY